MFLASFLRTILKNLNFTIKTLLKISDGDKLQYGILRNNFRLLQSRAIFYYTEAFIFLSMLLSKF